MSGSARDRRISRALADLVEAAAHGGRPARVAAADQVEALRLSNQEMLVVCCSLAEIAVPTGSRREGHPAWLLLVDPATGEQVNPDEVATTPHARGVVAAARFLAAYANDDMSTCGALFKLTCLREPGEPVTADGETSASVFFEHLLMAAAARVRAVAARKRPRDAGQTPVVVPFAAAVAAALLLAVSAGVVNGATLLAAVLLAFSVPRLLRWANYTGDREPLLAVPSAGLGEPGRYACPHCPARFTSMGAKRRHLRDSHGGAR